MAPAPPTGGAEEEGQAPEKGRLPPICEYGPPPCGAGSEPSAGMGAVEGHLGPLHQDLAQRSISPWPPLCLLGLEDLVHQEAQGDLEAPSHPEVLLLLSFPGEEEGSS